MPYSFRDGIFLKLPAAVAGEVPLYDANITVDNVTPEQLESVTDELERKEFKNEEEALIGSRHKARLATVLLGVLYVFLCFVQDIEFGSTCLGYSTDRVTPLLSLAFGYFFVVWVRVERRIELFRGDKNTKTRRKVAILNGSVDRKKEDYRIVLDNIWTIAFMQMSRT